MQKLNKTVVILFITLFHSYALAAVELQGEGYGDTAELARKHALSALSDAISVEVKSDFGVTETELGVSSSVSRIATSSHHPLLGVKVDLFNRQSGFYCQASVGSYALDLYENKLTSLTEQMHFIKNQLSVPVSSKQKHELYKQALASSKQFLLYKPVYFILGGKKKFKPVLSEQEIKISLISLEQEAEDLDFAATVLSDNLKQKKVFISPAAVNYSHEITPLSRVLRDRLAGRLSIVDNPMEADYFYKGSYEILDEGIFVTYQLTNLDGDIVDVRMVKLNPSAYKSYAYKPTTLNFDRLLHEGILVSHDFRVDLNTSKGNENLVFSENEEVELFVKLNRKGYFYIVSHVKKKDDESSYLIELNDSSGSRKFVQFVNADDANRWISIGKFVVSAPFGIESLQIIASTRDLVSRIPPHAYDVTTELYMLSRGQVEEAVKRTRGLRPKKDKQGKNYSSESVLMMTTYKK